MFLRGSGGTACCMLVQKARRFYLTGFIGGDGELVAGLALSYEVLGKHADVVGGGGVQVDDGGLVELRRDIFGLLRSIPGGCGEERARSNIAKCIRTGNFKI